MTKKLTTILFLILAGVQMALAGIVKGIVTDAATGEPLIGATVTYANGRGTNTDVEGRFTLQIPKGRYTLTARYIGYKNATLQIVVTNATQEVTLSLEEDETALSTVTVTAEARRNTAAAMAREQQEAHVSLINVSEQQIRRTQDKDAGEVIRRIPGISIIDDRYVMVRGLSQRYNNVWMNGAAVPSSEADQRAFSFDIIPSSQISNMKVVRSAAPEYPADYTGGFIVINTKDVPTTDTWSISVGSGINSVTHFDRRQTYAGSGTDFLGFDNGLRTLDHGIHTALTPQGNGYALLGNGLNNDWTVKARRPLPDISLSGNLSKRWQTAAGQTWGLNAGMNYSNTTRTLDDIQNNLFGAYDRTHDQSNYLRRANDYQSTDNVRLGAMLGLVWLSPDNDHRVELKQLFNQMGKNRYTYRRGYDAQSDYMEQAEYYYQSRATYNLGLSGRHHLGLDDLLDWNLGYAYANRNLPDRRRYTIYGQEDGSLEVENLNDINREFSYLGEHIWSGGANWKHDLDLNGWKPTIKAGAYAERRSRKYDTRFFTYAWPTGQLPQTMRDLDVTTGLLTDANYGPDGLYLLEQVDWSNNYEARNTLASGYAAVLIPLFDNRLEAYGGVRYESAHTRLISHTQRQAYSPLATTYDYNDLFPSVNFTYHLTPEQQLRMAYGRTTNRPEFRELSTSVYYDFDLASNVQGNHNLKPAYVDNLDLGWEWYPHAGEVVSLSLFYKHFRNPIEWTYTVAGGTDLVYSYLNAEGADNYGIEADIRKQLDFLGLPQLSLSLNASWIHSRVTFAPGSHERNRPMQGQSPYLVNAGVFYSSDPGHPSAAWQKGWTAALMYNVIGKRIIGVGRSVGSGETDVRVPDSYEMPRHQVDLNVGKALGRFDLRLALRDALGQKVEYKQFEQTPRGEVQQITRSFRPGRTFSVSLTYKL
ncbi:MAG: TonB-dependent receptor [Bacteroidales bacterium]|nr:TonB-dependent receptor [Bacteroidales bacterium]